MDRCAAERCFNSLSEGERELITTQVSQSAAFIYGYNLFWFELALASYEADMASGKYKPEIMAQSQKGLQELEETVTFFRRLLEGESLIDLLQSYPDTGWAIAIHNIRNPGVSLRLNYQEALDAGEVTVLTGIEDKANFMRDRNRKYYTEEEIKLAEERACARYRKELRPSS